MQVPSAAAGVPDGTTLRFHRLAAATAVPASIRAVQLVAEVPEMAHDVPVTSAASSRTVKVQDFADPGAAVTPQAIAWTFNAPGTGESALVSVAVVVARSSKAK